MAKMLVIFVHTLKSFMDPQKYLHEFWADYKLFLLLYWGCSFFVGFVSLWYHNISWWHLQLKWQLKIYQRIMYWIKCIILLKRKKNQEIVACKIWYLWCYLWQDFWWNKSQINDGGAANIKLLRMSKFQCPIFALWQLSKFENMYVSMLYVSIYL